MSEGSIEFKEWDDTASYAAETEDSWQEFFPPPAVKPQPPFNMRSINTHAVDAPSRIPVRAIINSSKYMKQASKLKTKSVKKDEIVQELLPCSKNIQHLGKYIAFRNT